MARRPLFRCVAAVGLLAGCSRSSATSSAMPDPTTHVQASVVPTSDEKGDHVAVVELFTSEGCSSCPRADALLGKLVAETRASQRNVMFLSFHVDYWDRLGYPDPWASSAYTDRQRAYAHQFAQSGVYTPQAIVSGTDEVLGSNSSGLRTRIDTALARPTAVRIAIGLENKGDYALDLVYSLEGELQDAVVNAAVVERDLVDTPTAGENMGATIHHEDVVRSFETVRAETKGSVGLTLPASLRRDHSSIVVFVQRTTDLAIIGATMRDL